MKLIRYLACSLLLVLVAACASPSPTRIPSATYTEPGRVESVMIKGSSIEFKVRLPSLADNRLFERTYLYTLDKQGVVELEATSEEAPETQAIETYTWRYDGKDIIRRDPRTGAETTFIKQGA